MVTWIAIQSQPLPWAEDRTDVAYVACGERAGELCLVRPKGSPATPALERLLDSIERAMAEAKASGRPGLDWLRRAIPDQGTSIRLSPPRRSAAEPYEVQVRRLAESSD